MDDIVKQARDHAEWLGSNLHPCSCWQMDGAADLHFHTYECKARRAFEAAALLVSLTDEVVRLREALDELADLMDDVVAGNYTPDSFTTQPARRALAGKQGDDHE